MKLLFPDDALSPDLVAGFVWEDVPYPRAQLSWVDWRSYGAVSRLLAGDWIARDAGRSTLCGLPPELAPLNRLLLFSLGERESLKKKELRALIAQFQGVLAGIKPRETLLLLPDPLPKRVARDVAEELFVKGADSALKLRIAPPFELPYPA